MSFYRFNQISGRLTPSQQFNAVAPQGLTPANKLPPTSEIRTNYPDMYRFRSTFSLVKEVKSATGVAGPIRSASTSLPTEFTITGFPKFPPGTKIGKKLVMGEFGPYSPKIRALQELFQSQPGVPVFLKKGASDMLIHRGLVAWVALQIVVLTPLGLWILCSEDGGKFYKKYLG